MKRNSMIDHYSQICPPKDEIPSQFPIRKVTP